MDIVSHGLWGTVAANRKPFMLGLFFGALPDILGMGGYFGWRIYLVAHSLLAAIFVAVTARVVSDTWLYGGAYLLHLVMDTITHSFGTRPLFFVPLLWRSYDPFGFHGWNWWEGRGLYLEVANVIIVVAILLSTRFRPRGAHGLR